MKFQFPHFSQLKTARLVFGLEMALLWFSLAALIAINILSLQKGRPAHWNKLMMLFEMPFSPNRYIDLASLLWKQGDKQEARLLMTSAQTLTPANQPTTAKGANVLGLTTSPQAILSQWEHEVDQMKGKYSFWQSVAAAHPDYRDAFISLASLAYQLGNLDEAKIWITKAQTLDPNSPTIQEFLKYLQR